MKPLFRELDPDCPDSPTDCSVYHDVFVFRAVYAAGAEEPYAGAVLTREAESLPRGNLPPAELEDLLRAILQRALIGLHTFRPDADHIEDWIDGLLGLGQQFRVNVARYAEALAEPDPEKVRRFIEEPNFYDPADPVIALARSIQKGQPLQTPVTDALAASTQGSHYSRALVRACNYLAVASDYFQGHISEQDCRTRLDIGIPDH
jgi:hypothetical protein